MSIQTKAKVVPVRFTKAEHRTVRRAAKVANTTASGFIRGAVLETLARIAAATVTAKEEQP